MTWSCVQPDIWATICVDVDICRDDWHIQCHTRWTLVLVCTAIALAPNMRAPHWRPHDLCYVQTYSNICNQSSAYFCYRYSDSNLHHLMQTNLLNIYTKISEENVVLLVASLHKFDACTNLQIHARVVECDSLIFVLDKCWIVHLNIRINKNDWMLEFQ